MQPGRRRWQPGGVQERAWGGQRLNPGEPDPETAQLGRRPIRLTERPPQFLSVCFLNKERKEKQGRQDMDLVNFTGRHDFDIFFNAFAKLA